MNRQSFCIIGVGSLGGFLCKEIIDSHISKLVIIDDDVVEYKNIYNSLYEIGDVGRKKVDVIHDRFSKHLTDIIKVPERFEDITCPPTVDIVIDCRDKVLPRENIDIRFYITGKKLIADTRKNTNKNYTYDGEYTIRLNRNEVRQAAFIAWQLLFGEELDNLLKKESVVCIDIDSVDHHLKRSMQQRSDALIERECTDTLLNIENILEPALKINKSKDINLYLGGKCITSKPTDVIRTGSINNGFDLIERIKYLKKLYNYETLNFIVVFRNENGESFIEIMEETGAA